MAGVEIQPVGPGQLDCVRRLFTISRATRHCWCMAFCSTSWRFATGWYGGGNQSRFEALAVSEHDPMGVLALRDGEPYGWCACGPRGRYVAGVAGRSRLLADRARDEDRDVWLIACLFTRPDQRDGGVVVPMLHGAVALARAADASAVEAWPLARGVLRPSDAHVGREGVFARLGFARVDQPSPERVIMRLELSRPARSESPEVPAS